jgi:hypothetical protein
MAFEASASVCVVLRVATRKRIESVSADNTVLPPSATRIYQPRHTQNQRILSLERTSFPQGGQPMRAIRQIFCIALLATFTISRSRKEQSGSGWHLVRRGGMFSDW